MEKMHRFLQLAEYVAEHNAKTRNTLIARINGGRRLFSVLKKN